ncbi:MAG: hypothetical protein ACFB15_23910 [Cyclobacteriaceae bacterium]
MKFELISVLSTIERLYDLPRTRERFNKYLYLLQGDTKNEMVLPIASFNPMGKELATEKLKRLIQLNAESIAAQELARINSTLEKHPHRTIRVALNLADDVEGSWSEYYSTDYKSKFEIASLVKRNFCTPIFWTRESVTEEIIVQRVREYVFRTLFWVHRGPPKSLQDCLEQEIYVQANSTDEISLPKNQDFGNTEKFLSEHADSEDYNVKFNFFYGDEASKSLEYATYGILPYEGFEYAKFLAKRKQEPLSD